MNISNISFVNIGSFFLVTQATKRTVAKLFSTGKFAPSNVRKYLENSPFKDKVGKLDFKLDTILKQDKTFPAESYYTCKNFGTTVATITAGIVSSNIITPTIRNALATKMQKNYINNKQENPYKNSYTQKSNNSLRI